ncbi:MAG: hypothetical protein GSR84_04865 [Desulfurococcales archaeon]|nr:hypothetical protein [Desulfurococcales archaeon]
MARSSGYDLAPVSIVKAYTWCPALAWFEANGPRLVLPPASRVDRTGLHPLEAWTMLEALGHRGHIVMEAGLEDPVLGLRGRVDYLAEPGPTPGAVVEYKARGLWGGPEGPGMVQAALYTIMAEHIYRTRFEGYVVAVEGVYRVGERHKARALRLLARAKAAVALPEPPEPGHDLSRCRSCIYRRVCPYSPG